MSGIERGRTGLGHTGRTTSCGHRSFNLFLAELDKKNYVIGNNKVIYFKLILKNYFLTNFIIKIQNKTAKGGLILYFVHFFFEWLVNLQLDLAVPQNIQQDHICDQ